MLLVLLRAQHRRRGLGRDSAPFLYSYLLDIDTFMSRKRPVVVDLSSRPKFHCIKNNIKAIFDQFAKVLNVHRALCPSLKCLIDFARLFDVTLSLHIQPRSSRCLTD